MNSEAHGSRLPQGSSASRYLRQLSLYYYAMYPHRIRRRCTASDRASESRESIVWPPLLSLRIVFPLESLLSSDVSIVHALTGSRETGR